MKSLLVSLSFLFITFYSQAQNPVQSSCSGSDSILNLYRRDADRMALRNVYRNNTGYKDSIKLSTSLPKAYLDALMAVYNATALPARDTIIELLNIHTAPDPEVNNFNIRASASHVWMMEMQANSSPTSNPAVNNLINKYNLSFTYYQTAGNDKVLFVSDSSLNLLPLTQLFLAAPGVVSSDIEKTYNDEKNIVDTLGSNYTDLFYSIGWGSCHDTCDLRRTWKFRVYNNCSVEYMGSAGAVLFTSLHKNEMNEPVLIYPNPSNGLIFVKNVFTEKINCVEIIDATGKTFSLPLNERAVDVSVLPTGLYTIRIRSEQATSTSRFYRD
jgi:hypothetical protein